MQFLNIKICLLIFAFYIFYSKQLYSLDNKSAHVFYVRKPDCALLADFFKYLQFYP